jgi:Flp pilus assembly protein TadD
LKKIGHIREAVASYDKAVALRPDYAEAYYNRGNALIELKHLSEAVESFDKAIALKSDYVEAYVNRGNVLMELKQIEEALASYEKAITVKPDHAEAYTNRGNALLDLKRTEEAVTSYNTAIALKPDHAEAYSNRGNALIELDTQEAIAGYDKAVALRPDYAQAYHNRALARLLVSDFQGGWTDYEWRWKTKDFDKPPQFNLASWRGEDLAGHHLLVFAEQGLGDIIQFCRYLPLLQERGAKITFLAPAKLIRLLRALTSQIEVVSEWGNKRTADFQCALMSLPLRFNTDLSSIPSTVPYLRAEQDLVALWKGRLGEHGFKVGIAWQGNPQGKIDQGRSIALEEFIPLARIAGVRLISLQKHHGLDQLAGLPADAKIETLGVDFDSGPDAFIDAAAVISNLDLIISSDTSIAHLAGALGHQTWVALKSVPDWRWLLDRDDSPWYPTMRLFRQQVRNDWKSVFARIEKELTRLSNVQSASSSIHGQ